VHFYQAYAEAGFDPAVMPIASLTTTEAEIRAMGFDVGRGHITAAPYFQGIGGERDATFVNRYKRRYGADEPTNMCVEAAYFQVHIFARALAATDSTDTDLLRPMVLGTTLDAPQGPVSIDAANNHTNLWTRIARANARGQFEVMQQSLSPTLPDPFMVGCG
jgi:branched-chain amino acid transport system substrate-binding protein